MTARDGFPRDMDPFALDAGTAERLVTGAVDVADAPPEYRAVAGTLQELREAPDRWELAGEPAAVELIAAAVVLERQPRRARRSRRSSSRVARRAAAAAVVCVLPLTGGLASAGALPEPAQNFASTVFGEVGISVPTGSQDPADDAPPATTSPPAPASSPGAGVPGPDVAESPSRNSSPKAPGNDQGDPNGTRAPGTHPNKEDGGTTKKHGEYKEGGQGGAPVPGASEGSGEDGHSP